MGLDIGAVMSKGIIIDRHDNIIASACCYTKGDPISATRQLIKELRNEIDVDNYQVVAVGVTGSARKLVGTLLGAVSINNEITAQTMGTIKLYPDVKTIMEIGGESAKIILVNNGIVNDFAVNTSCTAGVGIFMDNFAKTLDIDVADIGRIAIGSHNKVGVTSRCAVFAGTDLIYKIQTGYKREDVLAGLCQMVAKNYINTVTKDKKKQSPIVFNGGVSKNIAVIRELEALIGEKIIVNKNSHLMGAYGVAILARDSKKETCFDFNIDNYKLETKMTDCNNCANNCKLVLVYKNDKLIDHWGNRCKEIDIFKNV